MGENNERKIMKTIVAITSLMSGFFLCAVLTADGILPVGEAGAWPALIPIFTLAFVFTFFSGK